MDAVNFVGEDHLRKERDLTVYEWPPLPGGSYEFLRSFRTSGELLKLAKIVKGRFSFMSCLAVAQVTSSGLKNPLSFSRTSRFIDLPSHPAEGSEKEERYGLG